MLNDEILNSYLKDISKCKILNSSEIAILISKAKEGNQKAKDDLVKANLRFVVNIAKKYQNRGLPLQDLISSGVIGLIKSIDKYSEDKGTTFLTYAGWWIKQCIYNAIYTHGDTIRLPVSQRLIVIKILDATNEYIQKYSRNPSNEELSEITGIDISQINYLSQFSNKLLSVDDFVGGTEEKNQIKDIIKDDSPSLDDQLNKKLILSNLDKMLDSLPDREHDLIRMYFGIGMNPMDTKEIASMFGVCTERIRQMKESALEQLKKKFGNQLRSLLEC